MTIRDLNPRRVWEIFDEITAVPRPSKKEGKIIEWLIDFARRHDLECKRDKIGNVVMRKPATEGMEDRPTVILQSHMDMVCEKNSDVAFDFENDPIRTRVDGEWVRAEGTTLGADCGIGMAAALAVMVDDSLTHGAVEALFTVDEETGLTGAFELGEGMLTGKYLINLDSEDEGEIFIGCAGGVDTLATLRYKTEPAPATYTYYRLGSARRPLGRRYRQGTRQLQQDRRTTALRSCRTLRCAPELFLRRQSSQCHSARGICHSGRADRCGVGFRRTLRAVRRGGQGRISFHGAAHGTFAQ